MRKDRPVSTQTDPPPGLRERKKLKLRRTIQAQALRLFQAQGYEQTTVEQIAAAAETSTTTFYRYFPTKEDVVLDDDFDAVIAATVASRPVGEPLAGTIRAAAAAVVAVGEADREQNIARLRLMAAVPALDARYAGEERKTIDLLTGLLADRTGRPVGDYQLALTAAALVAVLFTAARRWATERGATPLATLLDQAITTIDPLLTAL
jgi:AcrR family transcriptional regulator